MRIGGFLTVTSASLLISGIGFAQTNQNPNILVIMADDWSWPHAGFYGCDWVKTPNIDKLAKEGVVFHNAFASAPSSAPSRFSILTGRHFFQNKEGAIHGGFMPNTFPLFTHIFMENGYHVGYTGKGCGPFHNPMDKTLALKHDAYGTPFNEKKSEAPINSTGNRDYLANFFDFLQKRKKDQPFVFSYNSWEPHRPYKDSAAYNNGFDVNKVVIPPFMPDFPRVRSDVAEYAFEVEYFDKTIGQMVNLLKQQGLYDNTLIVITADQGMPFPNAKMHCYEYGLHVPLVVHCPKRLKGAREVNDLVLLPQLASTFLELSSLIPAEGMMESITSILNRKRDPKVVTEEQYVVWGKEKHNPARENHAGYPIRAIRTNRLLYVHNFEPDRWPAGDPPYYLDLIWEGSEIPELAMRYILDNRQNPVIEGFFKLYTEKRKADELYDIIDDPWCLNNLAVDSTYTQTVKMLKTKLFDALKREADPRVMGDGELFESAPTGFDNPKGKDGKPVFKTFPKKREYVEGMRRFERAQ